MTTADLRRGMSVATLTLAASAIQWPSPLDSLVSAQTATTSLPALEVFVRNTDLRVSLRADAPAIHIGEPLSLTLQFENRGSKPLRILPRIPTVTITAQSRVVAAFDRGGADGPERRIPIQATPAQFVVLVPGQQWNMTLDSPALRSPLILAPGEYTALATYVNYPDYDYLHYDPYATPRDIWEGAVTAPAIQFRILPVTRAELDRQVERMRSSDDDGSSVRWLSRSGPEGRSALLREFDAGPFSRIGYQILRAMQDVDPLPIENLMAAIRKAPPNERQSILSSTEFSIAVGDRVTCELLEYMVSQPEAFPSPTPAIAKWFSQSDGPCPSIRLQLREVLMGWSYSPSARHNAAALLGAFRHPDDLVLLTDIFEQRLTTVPPSKYSGEAVRAIRSGALAGLSQFRGFQVIDTLSRATADERNAPIARELVDALFAIGGPDVVRPLLEVLSSSDLNIVRYAMTRLDGPNARTAIPQLVGLLHHRDPIVRASAVDVLRRLGYSGARDAILTLANDFNGDVQSNVLLYLTENGDSSLRGLFLTGLLSPIPSTREAAVKGLGRFGREEDFLRVRDIFALPNPDHGYLVSAFAALTFATHSYPSDATAEFWDTWYEEHRGSTRVEWAREALRRTDEASRAWPFGASPQREALAFLLAQRPSGVMADFERAAQTTRFAVRIEAARSMSTLDFGTAGQLLVREFNSRYLGACAEANRALNTMTGHNQSVDCVDPVARLQAVAAWQAILN